MENKDSAESRRDDIPATQRKDQKPRLLVLASTYPRRRDDPEPGFVHELARRLANDFEVRVIGPHAPDAEASEIMDDVSVTRYRYAPERLETLVNDGGIVTNLKRSPLKWLLVPGFLLGQFWTTWKVIRKWKPDVIHAHWLVPQGLVAAFLGILSSRVPPFLVTSHGADLFALRFWPLPAIKRFVARRAAGMTVVSKAMLAALEEQGIPSQGVQVQPMGVDLTERYIPDPDMARDPNEILFVGRLVEKKGLRYLLEAFPQILGQHPDAFVTIAGFGPEETRLRELADTLGIRERIHFIGAVGQAELPELYRRAAVFVAPFVEARTGDQEGLGLVTVEAIGCGCPVIVSDLSAVRDVVPHPTRRARPGDAEDLAHKVTAFLHKPIEETATIDGELRHRAKVLFDWSVVTAAYQNALHHAVKPAL